MLYYIPMAFGIITNNFSLNKKDGFLAALLFLLGLVSRIPFLPTMQSHVDSASFTLSLIFYTFAHDTPAPPGYPLYYALGRVILIFTQDPYRALLFESVLVSCFGAVVFYFAGKTFFNRTVGLISSFLFLSAPTFYFLSITAYPYLFDAVMTVCVAWCVYVIAFNKKQYGILLGVLYGISLGIRPQELLMTFGLFLFGLYFLSNRQKIKTVVVLLITCLLWFIPQLYIIGGVSTYLMYSKIAGSSSLPPPSLFYFLKKKFELVSGFYLTFGFGIVIIILFFFSLLKKFYSKPKLSNIQKKLLLFSAAWIMPPLLFNLFIRTEHAGYQTAYLTFFVFILAYAIWKIASGNIFIIVLLTIVTISANLFLFFYNRDPQYTKVYRQTSFHYSDLLRNNYELNTKISYIRSHFSNTSTLLLISPEFWRQYAYHIKEYKIIDLSGLYASDTSSQQVEESYNWNRNEYKNQQKIFRVPKKITTIVFLDDNVCSWKISHLRIIHFQKNVCLSWIPVQNNQLYHYDFEKFTR